MKRKNKKKTSKRKAIRNEDTRQRRKYAKGKRIEAYTFGEVTAKKGRDWPY